MCDENSCTYKTCPFGLISRCLSVRYAYIFLRFAAKLSPKLLRFICTLIFLTYLENKEDNPGQFAIETQGNNRM